MKFVIEQIAFNVIDKEKGIELIKDIIRFSENKLISQVSDTVSAEGICDRLPCKNKANLDFIYGMEAKEDIEIEFIEYESGRNFLNQRTLTVSHLGCHCENDEELSKWRAFFTLKGIGVKQEVYTTHHTNRNVGARRYHYAIFDTVEYIGIYLKFIVRIGE